MLIVNADDFGKDSATTDNIVLCFREERLTSTSAMVFMQDSERAADVGLEQNLEIGLHLNFDEQFTGAVSSGPLNDYQGRVAAFLTRNRYSQLIYNPLLRKEFEYLYEAQYEEFIRLYHRPPSHINGHHHMHLCSNVLFGNILPNGAGVRRSFTFSKGERNVANRLYRRIVDAKVERRFICTDLFFALMPSEQSDSLRRKVQQARDHNVELMVHLSTKRELEYLLRQDFMDSISNVTMGTYRNIPVNRALNIRV